MKDTFFPRFIVKHDILKPMFAVRGVHLFVHSCVRVMVLCLFNQLVRYFPFRSVLFRCFSISLPTDLLCALLLAAAARCCCSLLLLLAAAARSLL